MALLRKSAIVTGGGQGLGRAIAIVLARRGAAITVTGRTPATLDAVVDEIRAEGGSAIAVPGDVGDRRAVQEAVTQHVGEFGGVDILVNNAQSSKPGLSLAELTDEDFELVFRSGALGTLYAM